MPRRDRLLIVPLVAALAAVGALVWRSSSRGPEGERTAIDDDANGAPDPVATTDRDAALAARTGERRPPRVEAPAFPATEGIRGRVLDDRDAPIPGARVALKRVDSYGPDGRDGRDADGEDVDAVATDASGTFLVGPIAPGAFVWRLRASARGFATAVVPVSAKGAQVDIVLAAGGALGVRVQDEAGAPIRGAFVRAGDNTPFSRVVATSDGDGDALLDGLPFGGVELYAEAPGYGGTMADDVVIGAGARAQKTLVLRTAIQLTGRVSDAAGAPVAGARVTAATWLAGPAAPPAATTSDADGKFTLPVSGSPGSNVTIRATKSGLGEAFAQAPLRTRSSRGTGAGVDVLLSFGTVGSVSGTVVDADDRPVAGATVVLAEGAPGPTATTDAEGRFTLAGSFLGAANDPIALGAASPDGGVGLLRFELGKVAEPRIRLQGAGTVTGVVRGVDGAPLEGAVVSLRVENPGRRERENPGGEQDARAYTRLLFDPRLATLAAATDATGTVRLAGVPRGSYRPVLFVRGVEGVRGEVFVLAPGGTATFELVASAGGRIEGRVRDTAGAPVAGARIRAWEASGRTPGGRRSSETRADGDGRFVLRDLVGDEWTLSARATGCLETQVDRVRIGTSDLAIRLMSLGWIDGIVRGPDGAPLATAFLASATPVAPGGNGAENLEDDGPEPVAGRFAGADGTFRLKGLAAGTWTVSIETTEGLVTSTPVAASVSDGAGAGPIELRLAAGASIAGTIVEDRGRAAAAGATVQLRIVGEATSGGHQGGRTTTDASGRYELRGLAAGAYRLVVTDAKGGAAAEDVSLGLGTTLERDLATRRPGAVRIRVVDGAGRGVSRVRVDLQDATGARIEPNWVLLQKEKRLEAGRRGFEMASSPDAEGTLTRWHVPPGRVTIVVRGRGAPVKAEPVEVDVESERTVEVTVTVTGVGR